MLALYRKYRPRRFADVVAQDHIKRTLQNQVATTTVAHAYLFSGPRGLGKTTMARLLARVLNCLEMKEGEACGTCLSCVAMNENRHSDVLEIDAASHTGVDNVRENVIAAARMPPVEGKHKVFIIDEVHMLSSSAFGALLKLLEEPPHYVIFILATTEPDRIPETIRSRCQSFDFRKIPVTPMVERLRGIAQAEQVTIEDGVLFDIARHSGGCLRDAETLLGQVMGIPAEGQPVTMADLDCVLPRSDIGAALEVIAALVNHNVGGGVAQLEKLYRSGLDCERFMNDLLELLRRILLVAVDTESAQILPALGGDLDEKILAVARATNATHLAKVIDVFLAGSEHLRTTALPIVALEAAFVQAAVLEYVPLAPSSVIPARERESTAVDPGSPPGIPASDNPEKISRNIVQPVPVTAPKPAPTAEVERSVVAPKEPKVAMPDTPIALTLVLINDKWDEILEQLKKENYALSALLKLAEIEGVDGRTLTIRFRYKFYHARASEIKNRSLFERVASEQLGCPLTLRVIYEARVSSAPQGVLSPALQTLVEQLGGEVV